MRIASRLITVKTTLGDDIVVAQFDVGVSGLLDMRAKMLDGNDPANLDLEKFAEKALEVYPAFFDEFVVFLSGMGYLDEKGCEVEFGKNVKPELIHDVDKIVLMREAFSRHFLSMFNNLFALGSGTTSANGAPVKGGSAASSKRVTRSKGGKKKV